MRQADNKQNTYVKYIMCWKKKYASKKNEAGWGVAGRGVNVK